MTKHETQSIQQQAGHTPGPWHVSGDGKILRHHDDSCCSTIVAQMPAWWPAHRNIGHVSQNQQEANARLIAAAPELLKALDHILGMASEQHDSDNQRRLHLKGIATLARQALAKAQD